MFGHRLVGPCGGRLTSGRVRRILTGSTVGTRIRRRRRYGGLGVENSGIEDRDLSAVVVGVEEPLQAGGNPRQAVRRPEPVVNDRGEITAGIDAVVGHRLLAVIVHEPDSGTGRMATVVTRPQVQIHTL